MSIARLPLTKGIAAVLMASLCSSCIISGPHYKLDPTAPFQVERSGRIMKATNKLSELPEKMWHDQVESVLALDPIRFVWTPICAAWLAFSTPAYDIACLPRDVWLRNFGGQDVIVTDADGTPIEGATVLVDEDCLEWVLTEPEFSVRTSSDGMACIPRKPSQIHIVGIEPPDGHVPVEFLPFPKSPVDAPKPSGADGSMLVVATRAGVSYAPLEVRVDREFDPVRGMEIVFDLSSGLEAPSKRIPLFIALTLDQFPGKVKLGIGSGGRPRSDVKARRIPAMKSPAEVKAEADAENWEWDGWFSFDEDFPKVESLKEDADRRTRWIERRIAYLNDHPDNPDRTLRWKGRFPVVVRKGLAPGEWVLFRIAGRIGVVTEYSVEYGGELEKPVLHLHWFFNLEPGKDWFDMDGVPVQAVGTAAGQTAGNLGDLHSVNAPKDRR